MEPRLTAIPEIAREKVAADAAVLGVGRSERRDGAACAGPWILPWHADVLAAFAQNLAGYRTRDREVSFRRRFRDGFRGGEVQGAAMLRGRFVCFGKQIVQLIGEAAARQCECKRTRTSPQPAIHKPVRSRRHSSITHRVRICRLAPAQPLGTPASCQNRLL